MPTVGYIDQNPLISANRSALAQSDVTANRLAHLGQQVGQSIQLENYRKQAQELTPLISQSYQQAFTEMQNGNIGQGMSLIAGISAQAAQNPYLAPVTQQMNTVTDNMVNNYFAGQRQNQSFGQAQSLQDRRFQQERVLLNDRMQQPKEATAGQKLEAIRNFNKESDDLFEKMKKASTPEEYAGYADQYRTTIDVMNKAGIELQKRNIPGYQDEVAKAKIASLDENIREQSEKLAEGSEQTGVWGTGVLGWRKDRIKVIEELQKEKNNLIKASEKMISTESKEAPAKNEGGGITKEEFDKLPSGAVYTGKNGKKYRKP